MNNSEKNRYNQCLKTMQSDDILKPASVFCDAKYLEEKYPEETKEIREANKIKYEGLE